MVGGRPLEWLDQLVLGRTNLGERQLHDVWLIAAAERHRVHAVRPVGVDIPRPNAKLGCVTLHSGIEIPHHDRDLIDRTNSRP